MGSRVLRFRRAVIATGARAAVPPLPGLAEAGFLTNETIFNLTTLPRRLTILGAGPIGVELGQAFARFGSEIHLVGAAPTVLPRDDPQAGALIAAALQRDGVQLHLGSPVVRVEVSGNERILHRQQGAPVQADVLLVAAGRQANVEGLGLEAARVDHGPEGVHVDDRLRTSNPRIYAAGDVCSRYQFTHTADAQARLVLQNALFWGRGRVSDLVVPWCTYTDPEVAHVGLTEREAAEKGSRIDTLTQDLARVDRAVLDGESEGFVKIHLRQGTDRIVGATLVASHAGEILATLALAMKTGQGLKTLARTIFPYPTQAEALRKVADAWNRTRLTPFVRRLFAWRFRWWS